MAHVAADGSKWSNAAQARKVPVPGRSIGDGKQPVKSFSKPEAQRAPTASPVQSAPTQDLGHDAADGSSDQDRAPTVEVTQDGNTFVVTAKFASADEAHAAAQAMSGSDQSQEMPGNPAQAMM